MDQQEVMQPLLILLLCAEKFFFACIEMKLFEWIDNFGGSGAKSRRELYPEVMRPLLISLLCAEKFLFVACIKINCLSGSTLLADPVQNLDGNCIRR
jgi:hypothetical protein